MKVHSIYQNFTYKKGKTYANKILKVLQLKSMQKKPEFEQRIESAKHILGMKSTFCSTFDT